MNLSASDKTNHACKSILILILILNFISVHDIGIQYSYINSVKCDNTSEMLRIEGAS